MTLRRTLRTSLERSAPGAARLIDSLWISLASSRRKASRPKVAVLIAADHDPAEAPHTARSVLAQSYPNVECVVIASGHQPHASDQLKKSLPAEVRLIHTPSPLGVATSWNHGVESLRDQPRWIVPMVAGERLAAHTLWRLVRGADQPGVSGAVNADRSTLLIEPRCLGALVIGFAPDLDPPDLVADTLDRLASAGHVLATVPHASIRERAQRPELPVGVPVDVVFMPHNAYHTREMAAIARELDRRGVTYLFVDITNQYADEGSGRTMRELGLPHTHSTRDLLSRTRPGVLMVMNDWSPPVHTRVLECRALPTRSVALVEGVQDYLDTHVERLGIGARRHAYQHADVALLVGAYDRKFFEESHARVTGSTRIEQLSHEPKPDTASHHRVVINSNFTYGLYTNSQPAWLASVVEACQTLGAEFVISRHHADEFDFAAHGLASHVSVRPLYEDLREARVLVSRFSGVLLEAMALGLPIIYHNPHDERIDKFLDPQGAFPVTRTQEQLAEAIEGLLAADPHEIARRQQPFFAQHVSIDPERPSWVRIADEIERELAAARSAQTKSPAE